MEPKNHEVQTRITLQDQYVARFQWKQQKQKVPGQSVKLLMDNKNGSLEK